MIKNNLFFDFDGVIADTNTMKEKNIKEAYFNVVGEYNLDFVDYFTANNGIPREIKIKNFINNSQIEKKVLSQYNLLNKNLINAKLNDGLLNFLSLCKSNDKYILSGGDYNEIYEYLKKNSLLNFFKKILCGPNTKDENLLSINLTKEDFFIGDSYHDFIVAKKNNLRFVFMKKYSQEKDFKKFSEKSVIIVNDFFELIGSFQ